MSEAELFSDPRASLDKIAGAPPAGPRVDPAASLKGLGEVGPSADEALRDPFRPLGSDRTMNAAPPAPDARPEAYAAGEQDSSAPATASGPANAGNDAAASAHAKTAPPAPSEAKSPAYEANFPAADGEADS